MNVKEGDQVIKGQILATLDQTDLEREVEIARNAYELAAANQAEQNKTQALGYEKAVQDCQAAQADYDRKSLLYANGDISRWRWRRRPTPGGCQTPYGGIYGGKRSRDGVILPTNCR